MDVKEYLNNKYEEFFPTVRSYDSSVRGYVEGRIKLDQGVSGYHFRGPALNYFAANHKDQPGVIGNALYQEYKSKLKPKKIKYVDKGKRAEYLDTPEVHKKIGEAMVKAFKARGCAMYGIGSDVTLGIFRDILKLEDNTEYNTNLYQEYMQKLYDAIMAFERLEAGILCGTVGNPVQAIREFEKRYV